MPRRRQHSESQAPKSKKRPRHYHHGRAQGVVNEKKIRRALPAFDRAEAEEIEGAARAAANRAAISDYQACLAQLERVSPFVPALHPAF